MIGTRAGYLVVVGECRVSVGSGYWAPGYIVVCRYCGNSAATDRRYLPTMLKHDRCRGCRGEDDK